MTCQRATRAWKNTVDGARSPSGGLHHANDVTRVAKRSAGTLMQTMKLQATVLGGSIGAAWLVLGVNLVTGGMLLPLGIIPRTTI